MRHGFGRERTDETVSLQAAGGAKESPRQAEAAAVTPRPPGELNEPQKRRLSVTCEYIDRLLQDVEQVLASKRSKSPFARYVPDVSPEQTQALEGYIAEMRTALVRTLEWQHLRPRDAEIPASRAILINLDYIGIAIEELKPRYMRGSGAVPEDAVEGLHRVIGELQAAAERIERYLHSESGTVPEREASGADKQSTERKRPPTAERK